MRNNFYNFFLVAFCSTVLLMRSLAAVSVVYNLRIAETTKRQTQSQKFKNYTLAAVIAIDQIRKRRDEHSQNISAGLGTIIHVFWPFYVRADFAAGHVRDTLCNLKFSRTQTDDVILYAGGSIALSDRATVSFSGLVGIPTHNDSGFQGLEFGTGHLGAGGQIDGSYWYTREHKHALLGAVRYVRFFPENVHINALTIDRRFDFNLGNLFDVLIGHNSRLGRHGIEVGYDATIAFGSRLEPMLPIAGSIDFTRHSFYANYRYFLLIKKHPSAFAGGISWGFDSKPKDIGFKSIVTLWGSWGIAF